MYRNNRREGHDSIGTTTAATDYYLAEGCYRLRFHHLRPGPEPAVHPHRRGHHLPGRLRTGDRPLLHHARQLAKDHLRQRHHCHPRADPSFSTRVHGSQPIIAERAMYWNGGAD